MELSPAALRTNRPSADGAKNDKERPAGDIHRFSTARLFRTYRREAFERLAQLGNFWSRGCGVLGSILIS